jgi:hypothetical protein
MVLKRWEVLADAPARTGSGRIARLDGAGNGLTMTWVKGFSICS